RRPVAVVATRGGRFRPVARPAVAAALVCRSDFACGQFASLSGLFGGSGGAHFGGIAMTTLICAVSFILWSILALLLGSWLRLGSPDVWLLRAGLWLLGAVAAGAFWWFRRVPEPAVSDVPSDEMDSLLRAAEAKLRSGRLPKGAGLGTLPVVLVLGPP